MMLIDPYRFAIPEPTDDRDPFFDDVLILMHGDGSFVDSSSYARTVHLAGSNITINTSEKKFGSGAMFSDVDGSYFYVDYDSEFDFGTGDFTVEFFVFITGNEHVELMDTAAVGDSRYPINITHGANLRVLIAGTTGSTIVALSTSDSLRETGWRHVAVTRSGSTFYLFVDGVEQETATSSNALGVAPGSPPWRFLSAGLAAGMDELRITKGVARYTSNFTPPVAPFPNLGPEA